MDSNVSVLSTRRAILLAVGAVAAFQLAYEVEIAAVAIVGYLYCLFQLAWVRSARCAFYLGLGIGFAIAVGQLFFFYGIFGFGAIGLWGVFGLSIALYLWLAHRIVMRWPQFGYGVLPFLWMGLEYFRCELWQLRFPWLTPGLSLSHPLWLAFVTCGAYGFSFLVLMAVAIARRLGGNRGLAAAACVALVPVGLGQLGAHSSHVSLTADADPLVVGIQLEGALEDVVLHALEESRLRHSEAQLFVLSEYSFDGPVSEAARAWCRENRVYLIAGGKDRRPDGTTFYNTAFVVGPTGEIVFSQVKSVPVQFMADGQPAEKQSVWDSPWGKIGIAICYDLGYARVIDGLVRAGAQALVIPTMDSADWGAHEHWLHAKVAPVRAREYGIPIFRLASSGISQLVQADGRVTAQTSFSGQGEILAGTLSLGVPGKLPVDRYLALLALFVAVSSVAIVFCTARS
jgi:apolipoprotein N-acyltransferase